MSSVQGKSPPVQVKEPMVIKIWLPVGFHPATRSVQCAPANNTRKRVWQNIEKERKLCILQYIGFFVGFN